MDLITSVIAGFVVFTNFGGLAYMLRTTVDKVAKSGRLRLPVGVAVWEGWEGSKVWVGGWVESRRGLRGRKGVWWEG
jgi:hypothetical protein